MSAPHPALVVVQSRLASTRLPAKALLPLGGLPTVVLCARRAANRGLRVVVATSQERADDALAAAVAQAGIACFRGPHDDVLGRFVQATREHPEDAAVVRLTADNVLPDGAFLHDLVTEFERSGAAYLGTDSPRDGLPYGMSAEVFRVGTLREAGQAAVGSFDREHVTPWIRRRHGQAIHRHGAAPAHWSRLRCTLDTFADYACLLRAFDGATDAVGVPWQRLIERIADASDLRQMPRTPFCIGGDGRLHSRLTLGTVQLGAPYGVANQAGMPSDEDVVRLLACAADAGIVTLDTARAYGRSEARLGALMPPDLRDQLRIITKLAPIDRQLGAEAPATLVRCAVDASIFASAHALRTRCLDTLLLHRWSDRSVAGGAAWQRLLELKDDGAIGRLGASVTDPAEAIEALAEPDVGHLQCPVNVLDARWRSSHFLAAVAARPDVVVHARSVLLQGLLTLPADAWIAVPGVDAATLTTRLDTWAREFERTDRVDLCTAYVRAQPWVTSLVVGMETTGQLHHNLALMQRPALTDEQVRRIDADMPALPVALLDPARWTAAHV